MKVFILTFAVFVEMGLFAASHYVDNAAGGANDGSSWTDAWETLGDVKWTGAGSVQPGDTLYISGGAESKTYSFGPSDYWDMGLSAGATPANRITVRVGQDSGHDGWVVMDGGCGWPTNGNRVAVGSKGLWLIRPYYTVDGSVGGTNHLLFCNIYTNAVWHGESSTTWEDRSLCGININGAAGIRIFNCTFTNVNTGIYGTTASNCLVGWCDFKAIRGDAAVEIISTGSILNSGTGGWDTFQIFSNTVELLADADGSGVPRANNGPDGFSVGEGATIFGNTVRVTWVPWRPSGQHQDIIQAISSYYPLMLKAYNNTFYNSGYSMMNFGVNDAGAQYDGVPTTDVRIFNNRFIWTTNWSVFASNSAAVNQTITSYRNRDGGIPYFSNIMVLNNLIVDQDAKWPVISFINDQTFDTNGNLVVGSNNVVANNIILNCGSPGDALWWLRLGNNETKQTNWNSLWVTSNNLVFRTNSTKLYAYSGKDDTTNALSQWKASYEPTLVTNYPSFTSYTYQGANNDFHLLSTDAVAKNSGAVFSSEFTNDFDGNVRSFPWDIGPYEFIAPSNLVLWFTFEDDFTNNGYVTDQSGNGHNGWLMDATNYPHRVSGPTNIGGFAWEGWTNGFYPGESTEGYILAQYAAITNVSGLQYLTNATISLWVRWATNAHRLDTILDCGYPPIYTGDAISTNSWRWSYGSPTNSETAVGPVFKVFNDTVADSASTNGVLARWTQTRDGSTWYHMAVVWSGDGNTFKSYQNGQPLATCSLGVPWLRTIETNLWISLGAMQHNGTAQWDDADLLPNAGFFKGSMADVRIYNRALADAEIAALYGSAPASVGSIMRVIGTLRVGSVGRP